jgi:cytochrome bd ubiquinol oxidase subunit II
VRDGAYVGGLFDWLTPFSLFTGFGLLVAYALLGSTWLIMKTEGALQPRMIALARPIVVTLLGTIGLVSLWTPLDHPLVAERWFTLPNLFFFAPVPILVLATTGLILRLLQRPTHAAPFLLSLVLLFLGYSGLAISLWPNIIPPDISIRAAAAPPQSMGFTLVGALFIIPIILAYTAWSYYVFRGKVKAGEGYH